MPTSDGTRRPKLSEQKGVWAERGKSLERTSPSPGPSQRQDSTRPARDSWYGWMDGWPNTFGGGLGP
ncbi:hypothetical protein LZ32DRAFT_602701 [Colletotrichum eremochloae]|nr:hypothetical protein LZ32DRAFT_602701 [Colletotrichum eremochloae]